MSNKITKLFGITLLGTVLFACSPSLGYAQYYYNNYNYTPINITTASATNITSSSALLNGLVNGSNLYSTYNVETWFEYGTSTNFGYSTVHNNSNSGYASFSATVGSLSPNTIYYFRVVGQNPQGIVYGNTNSFRTNFGDTINTGDGTNVDNTYALNPTVATDEATSVGSRSAKLIALVTNSPSNPASTWFEWGTTPDLGNTTPIISLGTLSSARHINTITGLAPSTSYYFRAVIQNSTSKINGLTLSFTTNRVVSPSAGTVENTSSVTNTSSLEPIESALGANVIGSGSFFPVNVFGWLILIVLILVLILLGKHLHRDLSGKNVKPVTGHEHA